MEENNEHINTFFLMYKQAWLVSVIGNLDEKQLDQVIKLIGVNPGVIEANAAEMIEQLTTLYNHVSRN